MHRIRTALPTLLVCLVLAAAIVAVFQPLCRNDFIIFDDPQYITENPHVLSGLRWANVVWAFTSSYASNWHPLTWLSHMVDVQLFGLQPGRHHLVSLLFHAANSLLLFLVLKSMTGALWRSAFVAALFALHPLHVESVAWAAERKDVLSTFFFMLTLWAYARYARCPTLSALRSSSYALALVFFALGLMSKPMLVSTPFVLLLLDYWPLSRWSAQRTERRLASAGSSSRVESMRSPEISPRLEIRPNRLFFLVLEKVPFFALSAISCVFTFAAQAKAGSVVPLEYMPFEPRLANTVMAYFGYVQKCVWPSRLTLLYLIPASCWPAWQITLTALTLAGITGLVLKSWRRRPHLVVGWLWFVGILVPVIGLVQVGSQLMADRYTYVPAVGLFIIIAWGGSELAAAFSMGKRVLAPVALLVLAAAGTVAHRQVRLWRNSETVFNHCLAVTGDGNYVAHANLGRALALENRLDEARAHVQAALRIRPGDAQMIHNLGVLCVQQGDFDAALPYLREAVRLKPALASIYRRLGEILEALGKIDQAVACYREGLRVQPDQEEICNNLAWTLATQPDAKFRDGNEAVRLAEHACELSAFKNAAFLDTLAAAYAEAGRFPEAVASAQQAIGLATAAGQNALAEQTRKLLELYRAGKPFHEEAPASKP
jgi:tetratricopeptide (TPR) repeat protein